MYNSIWIIMFALKARKADTWEKLWTKRKQQINEHIWTRQYFHLDCPLELPFIGQRERIKFLRGHTITSLTSCRLPILGPFLCFTSPFLSHSLSPEQQQQQQQTQNSWVQLTHLHGSAFNSHVHLPLKAFFVTLAFELRSVKFSDVHFIPPWLTMQNPGW